MKFGPLSPFDINILSEKLDSVGAVYNVEASKEDLEVLRQARIETARSHPRGRPTFDGVMSYLYIEIADDAVPQVHDLLVKMGIAVGPEEIVELPVKQEFVCLKCDYVAEWPGTCPRHGTVLVDFDQKATLSREKSSRAQSWFMRAFLLAAALLALFVYGRHGF